MKIKARVFIALNLLLFVSGISFGQRPELIVQTGHSDGVTCVSFSPDGKLIASGSDDKTIKLWDPATGIELRTLTGHSGSIKTLAFSPDGRILASGSEDKTIKLWNPEAGKQLRNFREAYSYTSIAFNPDGKSLAAGTADKVIVLWDVASGTLIELFKGHEAPITCVAFSPDGKLLASSSNDRTIRLWDVKTGKEIPRLTAKTDFVRSVAFSPDGNLLVAGSREKTIKLWDVNSGREIRTLTSPSINSVAFNPDNRLLASGNADNTVTLWDINAGKEIRILKKHSADVQSVAFSPDGQVLASAGDDKTIRLWDVITGMEVQTLTGNDAFSQADWLVVTPEGLFDGSEGARKNVLWRFGQNVFDIAAVDTLFDSTANEFYQSGLLKNILSGHTSKAPDVVRFDRRAPRVQIQLADGQSPAGKNISSRTVALKIEVEEAPADQEHSFSSGVRKVRVFRNGSLIKLWPGDLARGKSGKSTLELTVPVTAGECVFTADAFNRNYVKSSEARLVLTGDDTLKRPGTLYILAVGIDEYANEEFKLGFAARDAVAFAEEVKRAQSYLGENKRVEVSALLNKDATRNNILESIGRLANQVEPEDALIVFFACHGMQFQSRFGLIPFDFQPNMEDLTRSQNMISDIELLQAFAKMDVRHLALIIDASHSGYLLSAREPAQIAVEKGMYILTAAQTGEETYESKQLEHGLLTYALLEAFAGVIPEPNGTVTLHQWLDYAVKRVPELAARENRPPQTPVALFKRGLGSLPFIVGKHQPSRR